MVERPDLEGLYLRADACSIRRAPQFNPDEMVEVIGYALSTERALAAAERGREDVIGAFAWYMEGRLVDGMTVERALEIRNSIEYGRKA